MASPQKRFRGVRKRHWGSWISEIRHSLSRTRIWLGMFETAEEAARAYDEAARLIHGPRARTNFPYNPSASKLLSATVTAKLHRCYMASLQMTKNASAQDPFQRPANKTPDSANDTFLMPNETMSRSPEKRPAVDGQETDDQVQVVNKKVKVETCNQPQTTTTTATITSFMLLPHVSLD